MQNQAIYPTKSDLPQQSPLVKKTVNWVLILVVTIGGYYFGAQLGSTLTVPGTNIGYIWPPVGISLALMLLFGYRIWPAIAIAAFVTDLPFLIGTLPLKNAILAASGQTLADVLEVVLGVYLITRIVSDQKIFYRVGSLFKFVLAVTISQLVSAAINISSLYFGESVQWSLVGELVWSYWISNIVSILIITPLILVWWRTRKIPSIKVVLLNVIFFLATILGTVIIFSFHTPGRNDYFEYFTFLFVIFAAFVLGQNGVTMVTAIVATITVLATSTGNGPFLYSASIDSLLTLEIYLATLSISGLIVASVLSERKQSELSLRSSEQLYRTLVKTLPEGIAVTDLNGNITFASDQLLTIYGSSTYLDAADSSAMNWIAPESRNKALENIQRLYKNDPNPDTQYTLVRKDGTRFFGEITGSVLFDNDDRQIGLVTLHRDITERKIAEDILIRQVAFDKMLTGILTRFASSPQSEIDSCVRTGLQEIATFIGANQAYISMISTDHKTWGITHEWHARELVGINTTTTRIPFGTRPWEESMLLARDLVKINTLDDFPPEASDDRRQAEAEGVKSILSIPMSSMDENVTGSVTLRSHGTQKTWTDREIDRFKMVVDTIASILERKQTQIALTQESQLNASMAELSQQLLVASSIQEIAEITLQKAQTLTGSKYGVVGYIDRQTGLFINPPLSSGGWSDFSSTKDQAVLDRIANLSGEVLQTRQPILTNELADWHNYSKLNEGKIVLKRFLSVPGLHGDALVGQISLANANRDYSENDLLVIARLASIFALGIRHAQAEDEVRRLNMELEQRVHERTQELEIANKELESFSYSISHDLRAPLRAIDGLSRIAEEEFGTSVPPEAARLLSSIRTNTHRMGHLIDDLLKFSRMSRLPLKVELVNQNMLVENALLTLADQQTDRQIEIKVNDLPECFGDPSLLLQVWINLLSNALKFTRQSTPTLIEIGSRATQEDGHVYYYVMDNGVGFDMQYAGKLFGVFQRLHNESDFEGTGVGLALVARIIHRHGGRIWAESKPGAGSTFSFTIESDQEAQVLPK